MPVPVWWKGLATAFRLVGRVLGLLRKVPVIDDAADHVQRRLLNPVVTKIVRDPDDPDLDSALELYRRRIPDDQRFESSDIIRWLREDRISRKLVSPNSRPTDWFVVAKFRRRVCGFILFHYYPSTRLALFAYMVVANTPGVPVNAVSSTLCSTVSGLLKKRKELRNFAGFALEVEDPRKERSQRKQDECLARVRRFCTLAEMQGFSLRVFDIEYRQPKLSLEDGASAERPMLLLSARTRQGSLNAEVQRAEVEEVLSFIYTCVYPEGFSTDPEENRLYREYCQNLRERELGGLPERIRSLSSATLVAQVRKKRKGRRLY